MTETNRAISLGIKLASTAIVLAGLYFGKYILVPIASAVLLSLLLEPLVGYLQRFIGRVGAVVLSVVISLALLGAGGYAIASSFGEIISKLPEYRDRISLKAQTVSRTVRSWLGETAEAVGEIKKTLDADKPPGVAATDAVPAVKVETVTSNKSMMEFTTAIVGPLLAPLEMVVIVLIFAIFILVQRDDLRNRVVRLVGGKNIHSTSIALDEASYKVGQYLLWQTIINAAFGVIVAIGMFLMKVPNPLVWGALVAVMRFVPYIGTWIAAFPPILLMLATTDGWMPGYIFLMYLTLDLIFPMVIEPLVIGAETGISPLSLLVAAVFWTWLWGPMGLVLSTPLTACLAVLGKHSPPLKFLDIMLTNEELLGPRDRFYQRLLGMNHHVAREVVEQQLKQKTFEQVFDEVLLPALVFVGRDARGERIDHHREAAVRDTVKEFAARAEAHARIPKAKAIAHIEPQQDGLAHCNSDLKTLPEGAVLCLGALTEDDDLTANMLMSSLRACGIPAETISGEILAGEVMNEIAKYRCGVVCISALPPKATTHARYLVKRIRARFPEIPVVIGLWTMRCVTQDCRRRINCLKTDKVVSKLSEARAFVEELIPAMVIREKSLTPNQNPSLEGGLTGVKEGAASAAVNSRPVPETSMT